MHAGIEAGGTKMVCDAGGRRVTIPTGAPAETLAAIIAFLRDGPAISRIGIASFGPLQLNPALPDYGAIVRTPKPGWSGVNLRAALAEAMQCPVAIDTDVNASGLAEAATGAGQGLPSLAYVTIGTGIGAAMIVNGRPLHGLTHPEMGHIHPVRHPEDATFRGACPFHADCLEGLASGTAIQARTGHNLSDLPLDHQARRIVADYLAQFCATLTLICAPHRIVLGGGVMSSNPHLFAPIRAATSTWLAGYVQTPDDYIVPPALGDASGITGALMLASG